MRFASGLKGFEGQAETVCCLYRDVSGNRKFFVLFGFDCRLHRTGCLLNDMHIAGVIADMETNQHRCRLSNGSGAFHRPCLRSSRPPSSPFHVYTRLIDVDAFQASR